MRVVRLVVPFTYDLPDQVHDKAYASSYCATCGPWMDRDSINYGYVMTGPGRKPVMAINTVHSGDYLQEIHEYYGIDSLYAFRKLTLATMFKDAHIFKLADTVFADFNGN